MALAEVRQLSITNIHGSPVAVPGFSIIEPGQTCLRLMTTHEIELLIPGLDALVDDFKITYTTDIDGGGTITVKDEGVVLGQIDCLNFVGVDVEAVLTGATEATVYVPPISVASHWNTSDGVGDRTVVESVTRTSVWIPDPNPAEGNPFATGGWAQSVQDGSLDTVVAFGTGGAVRGFSPPAPAPGDSTMLVEVIDADGVTVLDSYTTPVLNGNALHISGAISVDISGYVLNGTQYEAVMVVTVDVGAVLTAAGRSGGRYFVRTVHTVDTLTDDIGGTFGYTQPDIFLDSNPTTPSISGVGITETGGAIVTKHLSGIEYYDLTSQFTVTATDLDQHNRNTARVDASLLLRGSEYGLPDIDASPLPGGVLNGDFAGWTTANDVDNVNFSHDAWAITAADYRYIGPTANTSAQPRDPWNAGAQRVSANASVLVDTYAQASTDTFEDFDDEAYREGATFPGVGTWNSTLSLGAGEGLVFGSELMAPNQSTFIRSDGPNTPNADWTTYKPDTGGANPNYAALGVPVVFYRRWINLPALIPSFRMDFTGTFAAGDALADLVAGNLEIEVYRIGGLGNVGPPPGNTTPLRVHRSFNFATYDDGATVAGSGIRESSSSGNQINCTFGTGTPADGGMYTCIRILNTSTKIDSINVTFF